MSQSQSPTQSLNVIFRSCSRVNAVHGNHRVINAPKSEIVIRCLKSLVDSMKKTFGASSVPLSLHVVDDHSDPEVINTFEQLLAGCAFPTKLHHLQTTGNGASLKYSYELARTLGPALTYFVEDDYLHTPNAIREMLSAFQELSFLTRHEVVVFPCDYPDLYNQRRSMSLIAATSTRHWRTIQQTTATILVPPSVLQKYWDRFMALSQYVPGGPITEDNTINLIYAEVPCFSPMPSLAIHLGGSEAISPIVNWLELWNNNAHKPGPGQDLIANPLAKLADAIRDERGGIQPLVDEDMKSCVLIHSKSGAVRANHFHHTDWHYCYVMSGSLDYYFRPAGSKERPLRAQFKKGEMFFTPPQVEHAMVFTEDSELLCLGRNPRDQKSYEGDITRVQVYPYVDSER